jgi:hypothetical protein
MIIPVSCSPGVKRKWFSTTTPKQVVWSLFVSHIALAVGVGFMLWRLRSDESWVRQEKEHAAKVLAIINDVSAATNRIAAIEDETEQAKEWRNLGSILIHSWSNGAKARASFAAAHFHYIEAWKSVCWFLGAILLNFTGVIWLLIHWRKSSRVRTAKATEDAEKGS